MASKILQLLGVCFLVIGMATMATAQDERIGIRGLTRFDRSNFPPEVPSPPPHKHYRGFWRTIWDNLWGPSKQQTVLTDAALSNGLLLLKNKDTALYNNIVRDSAKYDTLNPAAKDKMLKNYITKMKAMLNSNMTFKKTMLTLQAEVPIAASAKATTPNE